jgi:O-antigen ligase
MVINLKKYWAVILILLTIVGFVSKALYNYPLTIMAIIGFYKVIISPRSVWNDQTLKYFIFLFLCLWIPMLLAFPDAVNPSRSAQTVFPYLRFLFAGIFIIHELSKNDECFKIFIYGVFFIVTFWCIDASIQFFIGYNLLGFPYRAGEITGMFYPRNTIAHICAILSPICFYTVFKHSERKKWFWLGIVPLFFVVLISGRRAAWVMLALCSFGFIIFLYLSSANKNKTLRLITIISCVIGVILTSTIILNQATRDRFQTTLGLFSFDYKSINAATAVRLPIWEVAYSIFKERPINGIGPRGFRFIYHDYAKTDDIWIQSSSNRLSYLFSENLPPTHPHLLLLEILVETGIIGLVGFLLLFYFLIKSRRKIKNISYEFVFLIPVFVSLFPFNSHMAFYGSVWSSMIWLLMAVYFSSLRLALSRHTI